MYRITQSADMATMGVVKVSQRRDAVKPVRTNEDDQKSDLGVVQLLFVVVCEDAREGGSGAPPPDERSSDDTGQKERWQMSKKLLPQSGCIFVFAVSNGDECAMHVPCNRILR